MDADGRAYGRPAGTADPELYEVANPGDYEAQVGQGAVTLHSAERLATTDRGVSMVRRLWKEQLEVVRHGGDPAGVSFDPDEPPIEFVAGNYVVEAATDAEPGTPRRA